MEDSVTSWLRDGSKRTPADVRAAVRAIVLELAPVRTEQVDPQAGLVDQLGYHSLAMLELAFTLEEEFDLAPIDEPTARRITTLLAIEEHVLAELAGRNELAEAP